MKHLKYLQNVAIKTFWIMNSSYIQNQNGEMYTEEALVCVPQICFNTCQRQFCVV